MSLIQPPWKLRRWSYIMQHFNHDYAAMRSSGAYDPIEGVHRIVIPQEVHDSMAADPKCQPPKSLIKRLLGI